MRKQDHLLQLISGLSSNEKRYFKLFSKQSGEKRYLELFDAMEGQDQYNAGELSKKLGIPLSRLAGDKTYLTKALLRSLVHYDEEVTETNVVYQSYLEAFTLIERRMFEHSLTIIDKALAKAWELELFNFIPLLLSAKSTSLYSLSRFEEMTTIKKTNEDAIEASRELMELQLLRGRATDLEMRREGLTEFDLLLHHPLLQQKATDLKSMRAQTAWFDIMHRYYTLVEDDQKLLQIAHQEMYLYVKKPQIKSISPVAYLVAYTRVADAEAIAGNNAKALAIIQQLIDLLNGYSLQLSAARIKSLKAYAHLSMGLYFYRLEQFDKSITTFRQLYKFLDERPIYEQYTCVFYLAAAHLHAGNRSEALDKVNELLQMKENTRRDLQPYTRILLIMLHVDLGNKQTIPYLVRTTKAWMKRSEISNEEVETFLGLIYPIAKNSLSRRGHVWHNVKSALSDGALNKLNSEVHLQRWVSGKLLKEVN